MIADLVATQESTLARLTDETEGTSRELASQQILFEEAKRKLKEAVERKNNVDELNDLDMKNILVNAERQAMERMQQMQQLEHEKESLQEHIG